MPFIIVGKPMSDLCWQCQQNSSLTMKAVNKSAREKSEVNYSEPFLYGIYACLHWTQVLLLYVHKICCSVKPSVVLHLYVPTGNQSSRGAH